MRQEMRVSLERVFQHLSTTMALSLNINEFFLHNYTSHALIRLSTGLCSGLCQNGPLFSILGDLLSTFKISQKNLNSQKFYFCCIMIIYSDKICKALTMQRKSYYKNVWRQFLRDVSSRINRVFNQKCS